MRFRRTRSILTAKTGITKSVSFVAPEVARIVSVRIFGWRAAFIVIDVLGFGGIKGDAVIGGRVGKQRHA